MNDFPFNDSPNTAVFTCAHVLEENMPILYVSHNEDGFWQFLCGMNHTESDASIVSLYEIYQTDNSIKDILSLDCNKTAERKDKNSKWIVREF